MRVHVAESFLTSAAGLQGRAAAEVKRAAFDFLVDPSRPGLHFHRLVHAVDRGFWSFRAGRDLRVIVHRDGSDVVLCYAAHHDRAYAWAADRVLGATASAAAVELGPAAPGSAPAAPASAAGEPASAGAAHPCAGSSTPQPSGSPRSERVRRRALAPIVAGPPPCAAPRTAPPPLVELLRFVRSAAPPAGAARARAQDPPRSPGSPPRRGSVALVALVALAVAAVLAITLLIGAASPTPARIAHGAVAQAAIVLLLGAALLHRARRAVAVARSAADAASAATRALADAVTSLSRGQRPGDLGALPDDLAEPRAALELFSAFLVLEPDDIRALAERRTPPGAPGLRCAPAR